MPLQEFLASYAVRVDEDGARRLQRILDQNRDSAGSLSQAFSSARSALAGLKAELSDTAGLQSSLASLNLGGLAVPRGGDASGSAASSGASVSVPSLSGGRSSISVSADLTTAEKALDSYKARAETMRPKLNVNTTGITSAVSSAISSIRTMMSSVSISVPIRARAWLDTSDLPSSSGSSGSSSGSNSGSSGSSGSSSRSSGSKSSGSPLLSFGKGGRVARPTLAMIAEEGAPEYVIPVKDESRALPLLRSLMGELSASARAALASGSAASSGTGATGPAATVHAPVNIYVTSTASAEAVGQSIYDTTRRSLLKTLENVFA